MSRRSRRIRLHVGAGVVACTFAKFPLSARADDQPSVVELSAPRLHPATSGRRDSGLHGRHVRPDEILEDRASRTGLVRTRTTSRFGVRATCDIRCHHERQARAKLCPRIRPIIPPNCQACRAQSVVGANYTGPGPLLRQALLGCSLCVALRGVRPVRSSDYSGIQRPSPSRLELC